MPRSSGTFTAPSSSVNPAVEGTTIDETDFNALVDDIETALTDSVYTSGLGSSDNRLVRTDGTDTKKVQGTGITVDDSNNVSGVVNLTMTGYADITEIASPSIPSANVARLFAYDDAGTTRLGFKDSAGTTTVLGTASGAAPGDVTAASSFGTDGVVILSDGTGKGVKASSIAGTDLANITTAASAFSNDNRLLRSDGTSKGVQASAITVDDSGNMSGLASIALPTVPFAGMDAAINVGISASAATNALTIALKGANGSDPSSTNPVYIPFRSATAATGTPDWRSVTSSLSVTIPASQALGTSNSVPFRVWVVALDNSGTVELAVINCLVGGSSPTQVYAINENAVVSTTAIASAPSAAVFYSTTARTSKAIRILAYVEYSSGLATAGTWASGPTAIQVFGPGVKRPGDLVSVVYAKKTDTFTSTSTTMTDITGLSASIAPASAANPVLATFSVSGAGTAATNSLFLQSMRGSTAIAVGDAASSRSQVSISIAGEDVNTSIVRPVVWSVLDAPGTTSSTTYKVQGRCNAAGTFYINRTQSDGDSASTPRVMSGVTLQELMA